MSSRSMEICKDLGIPLIYSPKAAKLALRSIPVAVVITIFGGELAAGDRIDCLDARHHLHREGQRRCPACLWPFLVLQVETGRRGIGHTGHGADVVVHLMQ